MEQPIFDMNSEFSEKLHSLAAGAGYKAECRVHVPADHIKKELRVSLAPVGDRTYVVPGRPLGRGFEKDRAVTLHDYFFTVDFYESPHLRRGRSRQGAYEEMLYQVDKTISGIRKELSLTNPASSGQF